MEKRHCLLSRKMISLRVVLLHTTLCIRMLFVVMKFTPFFPFLRLDPLGLLE